MNTDKEYLSRLNAILKEYDDLYRRSAKNSGLADCTFWILYTLREKGNKLSQSEICSIVYLPKQTVNSALKKLENAGYIELLPGEDRRYKRVCLTPRGVSLAEKTVDWVIAQEEKTFSELPPEEKDAFLRLFRKYTDLLNSNLQNPGRS